MSDQQPISHYKIITLITFICAAIITAVFAFHAQQKTRPPSSDNVSIFSVARDIKEFDLVTQNNQAFTKKDLRNHWTLLFFGFTHCSNVCPTTLAMISKSDAALRHRYPNLQVVLISLDPERDSPEALAKYTHAFNPAFIGATGKIQELHKLQSQFGIFSARDPQSQNNYQLLHTSSIMLIGPDGRWAGLFKYGMSPEQFTKAFQDSVKSISPT